MLWRANYAKIAYEAEENLLQGGGYFSCQSVRNCLLNYRPFRLKSANVGSILIEFVFCVPVIIILLFFVNDHFRFYELKSKAKTTAYLAASMIQQIGNTRADKQLTMTDLGRITWASCFNTFHTKSAYEPYPLGMAGKIYLYYIKRISSNSYQFQYYYKHPYGSYSTSSLNFNSYYSSVGTRTAAQIQEIHPDLICDNDGDERVMVQSLYHLYPTFFKNKAQLGFFILPIKAENAASVSSGLTKLHFMHNVVFTPKPGLFPVKNT